MLFPTQLCYAGNFRCIPTDVVIWMILANPKPTLWSGQAGRADGKYSLCSLTKPCVFAANSPHATMSPFFGVLLPLDLASGGAVLIYNGWHGRKMRLAEMNGHG